LMMNLLTLSRAMNVALARCNFKCSPYEGMLVQGRIEVLSMIMISMSPICVSKDCVKQRRFVYKLCSLWEWLNCQVLCQKRCSIPLESQCSFLSTMSNNKCWMFERYFRIGALERIG
jgi:hypothetical protein